MISSNIIVYKPYYFNTKLEQKKIVCDDLSLPKLLSACQCLTSLFGMGRGVSTEL